ncbi:MAG: serine hydrolase [Anaerolineaceae bacterium]|nr:serine hydrolase [Anaerolineaceae bacterium]
MGIFYKRRRGFQGKGFITFLRWLSILLIFAAVLLTVWQLVSYSRIRNTFPNAMRIADVPIGGLNQNQAADRIIQAYGLPIELHYQDAIIHLKPSLVGFNIDLPAMMAAADIQRINQPFWSAFWDFLWNRLPQASGVPLSASLSEERLRVFLEEEIASRYDRLPSPAMPVPGGVEFMTGETGVTLDIDRAVILINDALRSPQSRIVNLTHRETAPIRPTINNLQIMLQQIIEIEGFDGIAEIYLLDLQTGQELNFAYQEGENLPPEIAFTAASTMKIPIMMSVFKRLREPTRPEIIDLVELMIERSENDPADTLMEVVLDGNLGPLEVTDNMQALGFENTFLAGYFYQGAALLRRYETPANLREDIFTDPDVYNQTTAVEMGMVLNDIYQCAQTGGGALAAVFPGELSQSECQAMLEYLGNNKIGVLLQAGLADGTRFAHKHGWITEADGVIHTIGDVGIVYSPGGNYVICAFIYHPVQLVWEPSNFLMAQLSKAIYNYYNQY